jgi:hypothetical protein
MAITGLEAEEDGLMWHVVGIHIKALRIDSVSIMAKQKADKGKRLDKSKALPEECNVPTQGTAISLAWVPWRDSSIREVSIGSYHLQSDLFEG